MKNTLTKVLTIVAIVLVGLIAVSAITLALVKSNFNQVIDMSKVEGITVYTDSKDNYYSEDTNKEVFEQLKKLYNKGTEESVISALFQGAYSKRAKAEVITSTVSVDTLKNPASGTYVLKFSLKDTQQLKVNGEVVEDSSKYGSDKSIYYNTVYINIEDNTALTKIRCYIISETSINYSYTQVDFVAHHSELFDYISDLDFPG